MKKAEKVEQFPSTKIIWENIMGNIKYIYILGNIKYIYIYILYILGNIKYIY